MIGVLISTLPKSPIINVPLTLFFIFALSTQVFYPIKKMASLYLIPVTLGDTPLQNVLPAYNKEVILSLRHFIVEEVRTAQIGRAHV